MHTMRIVHVRALTVSVTPLSRFAGEHRSAQAQVGEIVIACVAQGMLNGSA
jgi:hypothetical protein